MFVEILTLLALYLAVYIASTIWQNRHLPPGPFPFPVLGNLLSISQDQPYRDFANMAKKYGKLFRIQMGSKKAVVINSYEIAREALLTKAKDFAGRPPHFLGSIFGRNGSAIGFESFSERWNMQHKMLTAALRSTEDKANISLHIEELCGLFLSSHAKPFCPRDNVYKSFGNCLSSMIFGQECKLDDREVDTLIDAVHVFRMSLGAANAIDTFPFLKYIPFEIIKRARRAGENRDEIFNRRFRQHVSTFKKGNIRSTIDAMLKDFWSNGCNLLTEENLISRWAGAITTVLNKLGPVPRKFNSGLNQILVFLARTTLDCKTIGFILKISKKKKGKERRKGLRRAKHASLTPVRACQAREKKNRLSVFHTMSSLRPGGSKMSPNCQKSVHNSTLFVNLIHSVIDCEGE